MKNSKIKSILKSRRFAGSVVALALAAVIGGGMFFQRASVPELPEFTDPLLEIQVEEDETPLASAPKVTTSTSRSSYSANIRMGYTSPTSYTKALPVTKTTSVKKYSTAAETVSSQTTVSTAVTEKFTAGRNYKLRTTVTTTVVTTTTTPRATPTPTPGITQPQTVSVDVAAPKMYYVVRKAFKDLKFTVSIDPNVNYSGYFNAKNQLISINAKHYSASKDTVYHELGHFIAFMAGNVDTKADFIAIYNAEKGKLTGSSAAYARQNSSEYFAECVRILMLAPSSLKRNCPRTYNAIASAVGKINDSRVASYKRAYGVYWKL